MSSSNMPAPPDRGQMMNYALRMVAPLRREFNRSLDVVHFMHDFVYAREIIDLALQSQDERLRDYAIYLNRMLLGPRDNLGSATAAAAAIDSQTLAPTAASAAAGAKSAAVAVVETAAVVSGDDSADQFKAGILKKYTTGLR
jgi:hypothetical protein